MRRLAMLSLAALAHLALTILLFRLASASLLLLLVSASQPTLVDRLAEGMAWALGFPLLAGGYFAGADLLDGSTFYGLGALNSAVWVAAGVLLHRAHMAAGGTA